MIAAMITFDLASFNKMDVAKFHVAFQGFSK